MFNLLVELSLRPDVYKELLQEQHELIKKNGGNNHIPFEMLDEMVYLDAFIKETIRLSGSDPFMPRCTTQEVVMSNGVSISKHQYVSFNIQAHNRDPKIFGPNANKFNYKRHIRLGLKLTDASLANLMWGAGNRVCLARIYAAALMKLMLAMIIRKYEVHANYSVKKNKHGQPAFTHYTSLSDFCINKGLYFKIR
ncbi:Cytochrome [Zancudomyces culisetae]|uniref:Cytochrome n=1 Tax=Zancudomyces culisetae TaxID=1213189 RepID=A0A1R1PRG9_ZANCU|nr:Cytochrome [Zancudomyces culisetae]|eukprot:OMH83557.1 Cytochrome [Zancudomyces culisetae]